MISDRISKILSNQSIFKRASTVFNDALSINGYKSKLEFKKKTLSKNKNKKNRKSKTIWFFFSVGKASFVNDKPCLLYISYLYHSRHWSSKDVKAAIKLQCKIRTDYYCIDGMQNYIVFAGIVSS